MLFRNTDHPLLHMHITTINKKETVNLKENKVGYMGGWWVSVSVAICCREERDGGNWAIILKLQTMYVFIGCHANAMFLDNFPYEVTFV